VFQELYEIHSSFLTQLRKAVAPGSKLKLSEIFLNWRERFLVYGDYITNLTAAQSRVQDICTKNEAIYVELEVSS